MIMHEITEITIICNFTFVIYKINVWQTQDFYKQYLNFVFSKSKVIMDSNTTFVNVSYQKPIKKNHNGFLNYKQLISAQKVLPRSEKNLSRKKTDLIISVRNSISHPLIGIVSMAIDYEQLNSRGVKKKNARMHQL